MASKITASASPLHLGKPEMQEISQPPTKQSSSVCLILSLLILATSHQNSNSQASSLKSAPNRQAINQITATDGDSLKIGKYRLRLLGIDALELQQTCRNKKTNSKINCGKNAYLKLQQLVTKTIRCFIKDLDKYNRILVQCYDKHNHDVGLQMILLGHAVSFNFSPDNYKKAEELAIKQKRGIWATEFLMPWKYRKKLKQQYKKNHPK